MKPLASAEGVLIFCLLVGNVPDAELESVLHVGDAESSDETRGGAAISPNGK